MLITAWLRAVGGTPMGLSGQRVWRRSLRFQEIPKELLEKELRGLDIELEELRKKHRHTTEQIVELERQRYELVCRIDGTGQLEMPL